MGTGHRARRLALMTALLFALAGSCGYFAFVVHDGHVPGKPSFGATPEVIGGEGQAEAQVEPVADSPGSSSAGEKIQAPPSLRVTVGDVELLYPGKVRAVPLKIGNPFGFGIVIHTITVSSKGTYSCPARFLDLRAYHVNGPQIGARSTAPASTKIALTPAAPDSCQGERFAIRVAVKAERP